MGVPHFDNLNAKQLSTEMSERSLDDLKQAFETFNQVSEQLTKSYHMLETRVVELSGELATVSEQRMQELSEK